MHFYQVSVEADAAAAAALPDKKAPFSPFRDFFSAREEVERVKARPQKPRSPGLEDRLAINESKAKGLGQF